MKENRTICDHLLPDLFVAKPSIGPGGISSGMTLAGILLMASVYLWWPVHGIASEKSQPRAARSVHLWYPVEGIRTTYAAYFYLNEEDKWKHLATFQTITGGDFLSGYYSFAEDFLRNSESSRNVRRAQYGNGWVKTKASNAAWPYDKPHYLILNAAIGGAWGGQKGIDDTIFPQKCYVDYVRVFEQKRN